MTMPTTSTTAPSNTGQRQSRGRDSWVSSRLPVTSMGIEATRVMLIHHAKGRVFGVAFKQAINHGRLLHIRDDWAGPGRARPSSNSLAVPILQLICRLGKTRKGSTPYENEDASRGLIMSSLGALRQRMGERGCVSRCMLTWRWKSHLRRRYRAGLSFPCCDPVLLLGPVRAEYDNIGSIRC